MEHPFLSAIRMVCPRSRVEERRIEIGYDIGCMFNHEGIADAVGIAVIACREDDSLVRGGKGVLIACLVRFGIKTILVMEGDGGYQSQLWADGLQFNDHLGGKEVEAHGHAAVEVSAALFIELNYS